MESPLGNEVKVGTVERAEVFEKARKPENVPKLWIDIGNEKVQSAAQTRGYNHTNTEK